MRTYILIIVLLASRAWGQISVPKNPPSWDLKKESTNYRLAGNGIILPRGNVKKFSHKVDSLKKECNTCGKQEYIGEGLDIDVDFMNHSNLVIFKKGNKTIFQLEFKTDSVLGMQFNFDKFNLPKDAELYIYSIDRKMSIGAFTKLNNNHSKALFTQVVWGNHMVIEYIVRNEEVDSTLLHLNKVIYLYKPLQFSSQERGATDDLINRMFLGASCEIDINCPDGISYKKEKNAVTLLSYYNDDNRLVSFCTGSLINTTSNTRKPYLITALHCADPIRFESPNNWIFYFNYELPTCGDKTSWSYNNLTRSISGINSITTVNSEIDLILVELFNNPEQYFSDINYLGWDISENTTGNLVSIHHPRGGIKKISLANLSANKVKLNRDQGGNWTYNLTFPVGYDYTHWQVNWNKGITEGGSSGSPLIKGLNHCIIGVLSSGTSSCSSIGDPDFYGMLSKAWDKSDVGYQPLRNFLDPANTGFTSIGTDPFTTSATCADGIKNGTETGIDCGGNCKACNATPTCFDYVKNGTETGIDCGGSCPPCPVPTCNDGWKNQGESGVDCGGPCASCATLCNNGIRDGDELEKDCGGSCPPCVNLVNNGTFDLDPVCFSSNYPKYPFISAIPISKDMANCSFGPWKSTHGEPRLYHDINDLSLSSYPNFYTAPILMLYAGSGRIYYGSAQQDWESCGAFTQLSNYLDPDYTYVLYFSYSNIGGTVNRSSLNKTFGMDQFDVYAASNLQQSNYPVYTGPYSDGINKAFVLADGPQFKPPTYPFDKLSILSRGMLTENFWNPGIPNGSWSRVRVEFTVDRYNVYNQLYIRADMMRMPGGSSIYYGYLGMDNIMLFKKDKCLGNIIVTAPTSKYLQSYNYIKTSGNVVIPSETSYTYKAGDYIEFNEGFETSNNTELVAELYNCNNGTSPNLRSENGLEILEVSESDNSGIENAIMNENRLKEQSEINIASKSSLVPNPATSTVSLEIYSEISTNANIQMKDIAGSQNDTETKQIAVSKGKNSILLDISHLSPGVYLCVLNIQGKTETLRLVVVR